jgi:hypothetical protein
MEIPLKRIRIAAHKVLYFSETKLVSKAYITKTAITIIVPNIDKKLKMKSNIITIGGPELKPPGNSNKADVYMNIEIIGHNETIPNPITFHLLIF